MTGGSDSPFHGWFQCSPNVDRRIDLFCMGHAGAGPSAFRDWAGELGSHVRLCALSLPGRERRVREAAEVVMDRLVRTLAETMRVADEVPRVFFGHSLGAVIAFELARVLTNHDDNPPVLLMLSGWPAPPLRPELDSLVLAPDDVLIARIAALGGTSTEVWRDEGLRHHALGALRADYSLLSSWEWQSSSDLLACPLVVLGGRADPVTSVGSLKGWCLQTSSSCKIVLFDGGHFYWQASSRKVPTLLAEILRGGVCATKEGLAREIERNLEMSL